jgi:hypothetical protein
LTSCPPIQIVGVTQGTLLETEARLPCDRGEGVTSPETLAREGP